MSGTLPVTQPTVADHFFYPPVGRLERKWDLYVEGTGYGTWPSELDPVWNPQPFYYRWTTGRVLDGLSLAYVTAGRGELEAEEAGRHEIAAGSVFVTFPAIWHRYRSKLFKAKTGHSPTEWRRAKAEVDWAPPTSRRR